MVIDDFDGSVHECGVITIANAVLSWALDFMPYSVHSLRAVSSLLMICAFISRTWAAVCDVSMISDMAATALATTWN